MKYTKPEINALGEASKLIEDFTKSGGVIDGTVDPQCFRQLNPAYELDE